VTPDASRTLAWYGALPVHRGGSDDASDAEIVRRIAAREGDPREAEAELCRRFAPRVRLYGLRHLRDEERARDLVQGVLLGVLVAAREGRVKDPERIDRFVLGTCRNVAARVRQNEARADSVACLDETPAVESVERVDLEILMRCFGRLDERGRLVVALSFQESRSSEEVASRLGTTAGNVRVLRHRAVSALRRCLDEHAKEEP
jgi:RNA polymerase sigma-70 factor (ECF subfamily)